MSRRSAWSAWMWLPALLLAAGAGCSDAGGGTDVAGTDVHAREFRFDPTQVTAAPDRQVTLVVRNSGDVLHNISIPSIGADLDIPPGEKQNLIFVAPLGGDVPFFCKFHRDRGMTGTITVQA